VLFPTGRWTAPLGRIYKSLYSYSLASWLSWGFRTSDRRCAVCLVSRCELSGELHGDDLRYHPVRLLHASAFICLLQLSALRLSYRLLGSWLRSCRCWENCYSISQWLISTIKTKHIGSNVAQCSVTSLSQNSLAENVVFIAEILCSTLSREMKHPP